MVCRLDRGGVALGGGETLTLDDRLDGDLDTEAVARQIPRSYVVKGMFFSRLVDKLGSGWDEIVPNLEQPPRRGRYVPFKDYPQADYFRLSTAVARRLYPRLSVREGLRRVARDDFGVFASSTVGKVVLAVAGDARTALLAMRSIYTKMASGDWSVEGGVLDEDSVWLQFAPSYGAWEYQLGQIEGLVLHYGRQPRVTVFEPSEHCVRYDIHHG